MAIFIKKLKPVLFTPILSILFVASVYGATLYVDTSGSDKNDGGPSSPWRSVSHALANAKSGDTISINDGTYSEGQLIVPAGVSLTSTSKSNTKVHLQPNQSLSDSKPFVLLSSATPGSDGNQTIAYLEIDGVNGSNVARAGIRVENRNNVRIHNCNIHDFKGTSGSKGVMVRSTQIAPTNKWWNYFPTDLQGPDNDTNLDALWPGNPVENFELDHNTITRCGYRPSKDWIVPAVNPFNLKNSTIHHNTIDTVGMDTECIFAVSAFLWNVDIYNNTLKMDLLGDRSSYIIELWNLRNGCEIYNNVANAGFSITMGKETLVHDNKIVFDKTHNKGIGIEFICQSEGVVYNNFISNGPLYGIDLGSAQKGNGAGYITKNTVVRNNVIHSTYGSGIGIFARGQDSSSNINRVEGIHIYNNIIDGIRNNIFAGIMIQQQDGASATSVVRDVYVKNNIVMNCPSGSGTTMGTTSNVQIDKNLFWRNGNNRWSNRSDRNTINEDPQITGPTGEYTGYQIADSAIETSPAVDAGVDVGLNYLGAGPDIGAFEAGSLTLLAPTLDIISAR